ncbi:multicomponent Na+:H+ antiporter subunit G [Halanaerobium saccharolyticum]|uniref:Multicomponent Na+:H+ antiporter subunit G n=1 Tax=Halanaerobium saccharolyticum TaxID=43595 RepID=A0A2T5RLR7_9FIRM|nr:MULTISPECIES: monovalent cation/H(+) antiporter subunit G [Halanaerobium]PTW00195.1 multicomponent Na+:H+ antiporter subunit G [Halanaerobium saccharolyticum]PUU92326.1 MAG: multicomponent Na+:H+ antiporter subunit G [Halanaerobium sp.]PUU95634.1 MAG: multicomponent Na+:H+ antiporter subunit G [Halanaerobium sp.]
MTLRLIISYFLMITGSAFAIVTVLGLLRFPDVYTRIHAGAVVLTISAVLVTMGTAIYVWDLFLSAKIVLIGIFFLFSNPMATHAIARASYKRQIALPEEYEIDAYSDYLGRDA